MPIVKESKARLEEKILNQIYRLLEVKLWETVNEKESIIENIYCIYIYYYNIIDF